MPRVNFHVAAPDRPMLRSRRARRRSVRLSVGEGTGMAKVFLTIVTAAAIVLAACGGSDGGDAADVDTNFIVNSTPSAAVTPSIIDDTDATPVSIDAPPAQELLALFDRGLSATYLATYRTTSSDGEAGDSYAVFSMPPLSRIDTISPGASTPGSRIVAQAGGRTAACSNSGSGWSCAEIDSLGSSAIAGAGGVVYPSAEDLAAGTVAEGEGRTIARQQSRCFTLTFAAGGVTTYCLNEAGVVLFSESDSGTIEADTYSTEVGPDDFLLP
jgi:hypothetical protein